MPGTPLLLALSGSVESKRAMDICFDLAVRSGTALTGFHVIDTYTIGQVMLRGEPVLLSRQACEAAYQRGLEALRILGEDLQERFLTEAASAGVNAKFAIGEGDPVMDIARRAIAHDLVVVGHAPDVMASSGEAPMEFRHNSVALGLAQVCTQPLLIVQKEQPHVERARIITTFAGFNPGSIAACLNLFSRLSLPAEVVAFYHETGDLTGEGVSATVRDSHPACQDLTVVPVAVPGAAEISGFAKLPDVARQARRGALLAVASRRQARGGVNLLGHPPETFIREFADNAVLIYPEDYTGQDE